MLLNYNNHFFSTSFWLGKRSPPSPVPSCFYFPQSLFIESLFPVLSLHSLHLFKMKSHKKLSHVIEHDFSEAHPSTRTDRKQPDDGQNDRQVTVCDGVKVIENERNNGIALLLPTWWTMVTSRWGWNKGRRWCQQRLWRHQGLGTTSSVY